MRLGLMACMVVGCASEVGVGGTRGVEGTPRPVMEVSPLQLDFGWASVAVPTVRSITVANTGDADLDVTGLDLNSGAFTLLRPELPFTLEPDDRVAVDIEFAATSSVSRATATVTGSDPETPAVAVLLSGQLAIPPARARSPDCGLRRGAAAL